MKRRFDIHRLIDSALTLEAVGREVKGTMEQYSISPGENAIVCLISCLDDHCTTVSECIKRKFQQFHHVPSENDTAVIQMDQIYTMRLFGGLFLPNIKTYESLIPAAHHIPNIEHGKLLVIQLTHIGYDSELDIFGEFGRYGHDKTTAACGAIKSLYSAIVNSKTFPKDHDLNRLGAYLAEVVQQFDITPSEKGRDVLELTVRAFEKQIPWIKGQLLELAEHEHVDIVYIGGVELDMSSYKDFTYNDKIAVLSKCYISRDGELKNL
ncbi:MAG TPA: hypothetical protein VJL89_07940 [Thermodesulfovibrionia bacterium]|nr:hypothetical protein [Thermodesulfovibrionia bacterium]